MVAAQKDESLLEVGQVTLGEAGTNPLGKMQPTGGGDTHQQRTDATATSAFPGTPATYDDFLGFPVFVFSPRRRTLTLLIVGITLLGKQAFQAYLR
ncbi:hypothetical protein DIJ64_11410 [Mycobacterium leprae]|uniref:Uncharacterized protein n=1 Tax=Mycobacterium leprae TaxID=1769 RepID=A0AAD0KRS8_MYCLR|nr:hypothetical protein DIJ64_11410 [Mycobacterium leprae]